MNEQEIFLAATQIEDRQVRDAFVDSVCRENPNLRNRVQSLLEQYDRWGRAMERFVENVPERIAEIRQEQPTLAFLRESQTAIPSNAPPSPSILIPGSKFGSYEIDSRLGSGGMGEVYLARDPRLERQVAIKILPEQFESDPAWVERFQREAKAASALNHPNILTVHDIGSAEGHHFIATEFVDGVTLRAMISADTLALNMRIEVAIQIADALDAAHRAMIVHRDIKPENIMVRRDGLVKVLDFGIAKFLAATDPNLLSLSNKPFRTGPGMVMGTVRYMSPEQARRQDSDHRGDIFSLGVVIYELLTGRLPFSGSTDVDVLAAIIRSEPNAMSRYRQSLPIELDLLVSKMLRKDPDLRFQSTREVAIDLRKIGAALTRSGLNEFHEKSDSIKPTTKKSTVESNFNTFVECPDVRYVSSGQVNIAYQVLGKDEFDMVFVMGWVSHLEWFWKEPTFARFLSRFASFSRLILFDKRGTGLSDRVPQDQLPTLETRMDDVRAVMDAVGSEKAVLCGVSEGGPMCSLFAATYPEKTIALAMIGCYARRLKAIDYPWGPTAEQHQHFLDEIQKNWGGPVGIDARAPSRAHDLEFRRWWATYLRMGASPGAALALTKMNSQIDVRPVLCAIQVPTIVVHRRGDKCLLFEEGKYLAENIPGAKLIELDGEDHLPFVGNQQEIIEPIEEFLTGVKHNSHIKRILATVLYASVVDAGLIPSTDSNSSRAGTALAHAMRAVELFRGRAFQSTAGSIFAPFDGPARAIRAA